MSARKPFALALLLASNGCALLGKSEPLMPRYFSPETSEAGPAQGGARTDGTATELRLGRVSAASHLGERIVFRDSEYELGFYEERRWSERPEHYLRRALARSLFERRGLQRIVSGGGPTLDVELTELAEVKGPSPIARVRVTYVLFDGRAVRAESTITVERPIAAVRNSEAAPEAAVRAMTAALTNAVEQIVERVVTELRSRAASASSDGTERHDATQSTP